MIGICEDLRKSVLQAAIQGRLTQQLPEDGNAEDLYKEIQAEKQTLIKEGKIKKEKPLSEITDDDIPFDIPENWKWVRLGTVIKLQSGQDFESSGYNDKGQGIPYLTGASNLENGNVIINRWTTCPRCVVKGGTLLIVCKGAGVGKMAFLKIQEAHIARQLMGITTYSISLEYVKILLDKNVNDIRMNMQGIIPGISREDILNILLPLPPLAEQKRIVARVDELMARIDELERTEEDITALYDAFHGDMKASLLQAAIQGKLTEQLASDGDAETLYANIQKEKQRLIKEGKIKKEKPLPEITDDDIPFDIPENWKWVHLHDVIYHVGNKNNQILAKEIKPEGKYPVVSQGVNLIDGYCDNGERQILDYPVVMFGDHTKNVKYIDFPFVIGADGTKFMKPILNNPRYLFYWTLFSASQLHNRGYARHYTLLARVLFPLPPLAEQKRIVEKLDQLLPLCDSMKEAIDATA